jgi:hypothetical protein
VFLPYTFKKKYTRTTTQHNTKQNKTKQNRPVALAGCSQTLVFDVFFTSLGSLA